MRWVCSGGFGLLIGLCSWVCVCGQGQSQDQDRTMFVFVGLCWWLGLVRLKPSLAWHCYGWLLLAVAVVWVFFWLSLGFLVTGFVGLLNLDRKSVV